MRTIELTIFNYDELPTSIQQKVLCSLSNINVEHYEWYDSEFDYWKEKLEEFGFMEPKIYFSGFHSQGDGACFDCEYIKLEHAWEYFKKDMERQNNWIHRKLQVHEAWFYDYLDNHVYLNMQCVNSHYSHENAYKVRGLAGSHLEGVLFKCYQEFVSWMEDFRRGLCMELYHNLSDAYEYLISDEAILETIQSNEYEFYENGKIA
jgi:hypothetical protein